MTKKTHLEELLQNLNEIGPIARLLKEQKIRVEFVNECLKVLLLSVVNYEVRDNR
jgi:hypothetical protein